MKNLIMKKGGVGVRFQLNKTKFCFVTAHLAAHQNKVQQRNQNFENLLENLIFDNTVESISVEKHDLVFFYGDLNYRINLSHEECLELIKEKEFEKLSTFDQLTIEKDKGNNSLSYFEEGKLNFYPSYKFDLNSSDYDSTEKKRVPSYCDRIIWMNNQKEEIELKQEMYTSLMEYEISDHKPIVSVFNLKIKLFDPKKYEKLKLELIKQQQQK